MPYPMITPQMLGLGTGQNWMPPQGGYIPNFMGDQPGTPENPGWLRLAAMYPNGGGLQQIPGMQIGGQMPMQMQSRFNLPTTYGAGGGMQGGGMFPQMRQMMGMGGYPGMGMGGGYGIWPFGPVGGWSDTPFAMNFMRGNGFGMGQQRPPWMQGQSAYHGGGFNPWMPTSPGGLNQQGLIPGGQNGGLGGVSAPSGGMAQQPGGVPRATPQLPTGIDQTSGQPWGNWQSTPLGKQLLAGQQSLYPPGGGQMPGGGMPQMPQAPGAPGMPTFDLMGMMKGAQGGDPTAQYNLMKTPGWQMAAGGDLGGAANWAAGMGMPMDQAKMAASWVQQNPNIWAGDMGSPLKV